MKARDTFYYIITNIFSLFPNIKNDKKLFVLDTEDWFKKEGMIILIASWTVLLFVNSILSMIAGDFFPDNTPQTINFLEDFPNLINYILIVPLYTLIGITFIIHSRRIRENLFNSKLFLELKFSFNKRNHSFAVLFYFVLAFVFSIIVIAFYGSELNEYKYNFWFQAGESRIQIAHNIYYMIYSFVLLLIVLTSVAFHFEMFWIAKKIGATLKKLILENKNEKKKSNTIPPILFEYKKIKEIFAPFISLYTLSKILIIAILLNLYTWKAQEPDFVGMLDVSIIAYALLGAAIVSYPRYHIQYWIYKLWQKHEKDEYPDIRLSFTQGIAGLADVFILGAALLNLLNYLFIKINADINIINLFKDLF